MPCYPSQLATVSAAPEHLLDVDTRQGEGHIVLGPDWLLTSDATLCNDDFGAARSARSSIASLPEGYHWSSNDGETPLYRCTAVQ